LSKVQFFWLFILGTVCTSFAFLIGVYVMKFIPAYTVNLSVNLEPIYAIILAIIIFKKSEVMSLNFYVGSTVVVGAILLNAFFKKKKKPHIVA
jgi:drug/metabolite transporter (DMT)-like permease